MNNVSDYFPDLTPWQIEKFDAMPDLYQLWNGQINVISRKDMDQFFVRHLLHSLTIAKKFSFSPGVKILDIGTGGGFPGIPLAIMYPETEFWLVDSVNKKTIVAENVREALGLDNVVVINERVETLQEHFDFIVSRAVAPLPKLIGWTKHLLLKGFDRDAENGYICLKGGDLEEEIKESKSKCLTFLLSDIFNDPFFETKKMLYLPKSGLGKRG